MSRSDELFEDDAAAVRGPGDRVRQGARRERLVSKGNRGQSKGPDFSRSVGALAVEMVGRRVRVRLDDGRESVLPARGALVAVADRVQIVEGVIVGTEPRRSTLERTGDSAGVRLVASNATLLACVCASTDPPFRPGLVDRMLVAAGAGNMQAMVVLNKCDTGMPGEVLEWMARYEALGYGIALVSASDGRGIAELAERLREHTTVLVGHSGVGKSTLVRALVPGADVRVGDIDAWGRGRHTTTAAQLFSLPGGGQIIDVPGVREFGVAHVDRRELRTHFPELLDLPCKYRDCLHEGEEGCVADEVVSWPERLESYRKLLGECV
ncbi:MAG: ribosome small subunit-dependent GTPase A [Deltaproteobacteria bacterium]|nr:ribosome small subunit-dependent GTPase A [Deltaproteobacteria bacterium]